MKRKRCKKGFKSRAGSPNDKHPSPRVLAERFGFGQQISSAFCFIPSKSILGAIGRGSLVEGLLGFMSDDA